MISVTAFGRVPPGKMVHRSGAKPGDRVVVTGTIGDAALGLDILKGGKVHAARDRRRRGARDAGRPLPRAAAAQWRWRRSVRDHASAAMDVSDGLAGDLAKLCARVRRIRRDRLADDPAVGCGAAIWCRAASSALETLISGGDDYEILCTIPEDRFEAFAQAAQRAGVAVSSIGTVIAGSAAPKFLDAQGREIALERLLLQPFLRSSCVNAAAFISRQPLQFCGKPIGVSPFDYRRAFLNAPLGASSRDIVEIGFESVRSPCGMKAYVLWRRENGYGNSEVVQRSKGFRFH